MKKIIDLDSRFKKQVKEAKALNKFHEKMWYIRKQIESCQTIPQLENVINWSETILKYENKNEYIDFNFQNETFRQWFIFLANKRELELELTQTDGIRKK